MTKSGSQLGADIVAYIKNPPNCSSKQIHDGIATFNRYHDLVNSVADDLGTLPLKTGETMEE